MCRVCVDSACVVCQQCFGDVISVMLSGLIKLFRRCRLGGVLKLSHVVC